MDYFLIGRQAAESLFSIVHGFAFVGVPFDDDKLELLEKLSGIDEVIFFCDVVTSEDIDSLLSRVHRIKRIQLLSTNLSRDGVEQLKRKYTSVVFIGME